MVIRSSLSLLKLQKYYIGICKYHLILVVARSKAWVCGRLLAGIAGSNPAGGKDVCL